MINQCCRHCLNAYNNPYTTKVLCANKEFDAQFWDVRTWVLPNETCGRWTRRRDNQPKLNFDIAIQLTLFD